MKLKAVLVGLAIVLAVVLAVFVFNRDSFADRCYERMGYPVGDSPNRWCMSVETGKIIGMEN